MKQPKQPKLEILLEIGLAGERIKQDDLMTFI